MPKPKKPNGADTQLTIRVPLTFLEKAEALRAPLTRYGLCPSRPDVVRQALARGLEALEKEMGKRRLRDGSR
jgi:hypothetical protein